MWGNSIPRIDVNIWIVVVVVVVVDIRKGSVNFAEMAGTLHALQFPRDCNINRIIVFAVVSNSLNNRALLLESRLMLTRDYI